MWVKSGRVLFKLALVLENTSTLTFLAFGSFLFGKTEFIRGLKPGSKAVGGFKPLRRACGCSVAPVFILQRLLHVPSMLRNGNGCSLIHLILSEIGSQFDRNSVSFKSRKGYDSPLEEYEGRTS